MTSSLKLLLKTSLLSSLNKSLLNSSRCITTSLINGDSEKTWFDKFRTVRNIEAGKDAHSKLLADPEAIYEMQIHNVYPGKMDDYLKNCEIILNELQTKVPNTELVASFHVEIGDMDQVINILRYKKGYLTVAKAHDLLRTDDSLIKLTNNEIKLLRKRENQLMARFSFWGATMPAVRNCHYEMRTYVLKPGTMIEFANHWARGINFRQNRVGGYFSQIGQMYMVHHLWHYDSYQNRKDVREAAWSKPGWDQVVSYTDMASAKVIVQTGSSSNNWLLDLIGLSDLARMNKRQVLYQLLNLLMIVSSALMIWKGLMVVAKSESPIVVVLSGSMEPAFYRGDLLFLTNYKDDSLKAGEIVVFKIEGRDIPIVHRIIKLHEKEDGSVKILTKGDNNSVDDRGLYAPGQNWLEKKDIVGRVKGFVPYVGIVTILMNDYPNFKYAVLAILAIYVIANRE